VPLTRQRIVVLGAGAAGIGIARQLRGALERAGLAGDGLRRALALVDVAGLLVHNGQALDEHQLPFGWPVPLAEEAGLGEPHDLSAVIEAVKPTALIGACGQPGAFTAAIVEAMAAHVERPVIFPLSNPTSQSEAQPVDVLAWSGGRALVATGSPFEDVPHGGGQIRIGQCNNAFIFPGIGLGALVAQAREVTDGMFQAAADCLAAQVSQEDLQAGALYPRVRDLRRVSTRVAECVVREAREAGIGLRLEDDQIPGAVAALQWTPRYVPLEVRNQQ
jgi:malate dehydrogenase (oxaloacetate-decarboxylating)